MENDKRMLVATNAGYPEWAELPATAKEAFATGVTTYFTGKPCKRGHVSLRRRVGHCIECQCRSQHDYSIQPHVKKRQREYHRKRNARPEVKQFRREYMREYFSRPTVKERDRECQIKYNARPEVKERATKYQRKRNARPEIKKWVREYDRQWRANNRDKERAYMAHRRALKQNATPEWLTQADREAITAVYSEAQRLTEATGEPHHVDHIILLNHPDVCGLHVAANLQVLTAPDNLSKNNTFDGTQDNESWRLG